MQPTAIAKKMTTDAMVCVRFMGTSAVGFCVYATGTSCCKMRRLVARIHPRLTRIETHGTRPNFSSGSRDPHPWFPGCTQSRVCARKADRGQTPPVEEVPSRALQPSSPAASASGPDSHPPGSIMSRKYWSYTLLAVSIFRSIALAIKSAYTNNG